MSQTALQRLTDMMPDVSESEANTALAKAAERLSSTVLGDRYSEATALLAAHGLELRQRYLSGLTGAGPVSSQSGSGPDGATANIGFGTSMLRGSWSQTPWGVELRSLIRHAVPVTAQIASVTSVT